MPAAPRPRIVVVGSANSDLWLRVDRIPRVGETVLGREFGMGPGGKGANQAVAAARAGAEVAFVGRVGRDPLGDNAVETLRREGIEVRHLRRDSGQPTGTALIFVDAAGRNSIGISAGANAQLSPADILRAAPLITRAGALLVQLEVPLPTVEAAVDMAARYGALVILNPAPVQRLPPRLLRRTDWLTPNRVEAEQLAAVRITDDVDAAVAAKKLLKTGVGGVCLTLGEGGALLVTKNRIERVPGFKVKAIDTTAAGDVFNGVFALGLVEGRSAFEAARFANAAAALSVTRVGAQCSMPRRHDVERWLRRYSSRVLKWERI